MENKLVVKTGMATSVVKFLEKTVYISIKLYLRILSNLLGSCQYVRSFEKQTVVEN